MGFPFLEYIFSILEDSFSVPESVDLLLSYRRISLSPGNEFGFSFFLTIDFSRSE